MSMIFKFRALSDENDRFIRDYEIKYDNSLLDFHYLLCEELGFDPDAMACFYGADQNWERGQEYTLVDMGNSEESPIPMFEALLGKIIRKNNDRLIYMFDLFGGRALYMEMTGTYQTEEGVEYPREVFAEGEAPLQFDAAAGAPESIFEEALGEFSDFEGDEFYDDDF